MILGRDLFRRARTLSRRVVFPPGPQTFEDKASGIRVAALMINHERET